MTLKLQNKGEANKAALPLYGRYFSERSASRASGGFAEKRCGDESYKKLYIFPESNDNRLKLRQKQNE